MEFLVFLGSRSSLAPTGRGIVGPEEAGRHASPGRPGSSDLPERGRIRSRRMAERVADGVLQGDVSGREDIGMAGCRKQIDLGRPRTNSLDRRHAGDRLVSRVAAQPFEIEVAADHRFADVDQRALLGSREPGNPPCLLATDDEIFRRQRIDRAPEPFPDGIGTRLGHLLGDDDGGKALEAWLGAAKRHSPGCLPDRSQPPVDPHQRFEPRIDIVERFDPLHCTGDFR